jgi:PAS domain S-box-containing protein
VAGPVHTDENKQESARLAALDYLDAVRSEADQVLQKLVDKVRSIFGTDLCMVNLILPDVQYFRAWSGDLPADLAEARQDPRERSMCQYTVKTKMPFVVHDFLATEEFKDQHFFVNYGFRFYAGAPLITSEGHAIGDLCLLDTRPHELSEQQIRMLEGFAEAVVGRLQVLGALGREQAATEKEVQRSRDIASILQRITDAFFALDNQWRFIYLNSEAERILNRKKEQLLGKNLWEEFPESVDSTFDREYRKALAEQVTVGFEEYYPPLGVWVAVRAYPSEDGLSVYFRDISEAKHAQEELETRVRQQAAVAQLGQRALQRIDLSVLMDETALIVAENLGVEYSKVLELLPQDDVLLLRSGVGWEEGLVGEATEGAGVDSQGGYTLLSSKPVIVEDTQEETRFNLSSLLQNHGIVSGVTVIIHGEEQPFGILAAHTRRRRRFTQHDINFLQTVANVLATTIEHSRAEKALRESEERFRSLVRFASDIITILDGDGTIRYESPAIERVLGYKPEDLIGSNAFDYVHPDDVERVSSVLAEALETQGVTPLVEYRFRCADGTWCYLEAIGNNLIAEPSVQGIVVNSRDITERKRAEKERAHLLAREQAARAEAEAVQALLNATLDNLAEGVLVANLQGHMLFANLAARAMVGTTTEEFPQELPNPWEDFHLPEAVAHCAKSRESIEAQVRHGDTFLRVKLECLVESNNQGDVLVVIQDLSEGRRLEANQQRFLANAAHQLRTPTMSIMGAAELLATGEDANPATRERLLNHIFSEGRRMQRLSDALLRLSRVGWDLREPSLEVVDLKAAGQQAAGVMEPLVESAGLRLSIEGEDACVRADPEWLQEVLLVLLSNAIKHSSRGGDIRLRARASSVIVEDEGAGVSSADLPHIFERFYRGKGHAEGFGLGLSICRELTERMGGGISVRSREGVGTAVEVELPEVDVDECSLRHND